MLWFVVWNTLLIPIAPAFGLGSGAGVFPALRRCAYCAGRMKRARGRVVGRRQAPTIVAPAATTNSGTVSSFSQLSASQRFIKGLGPDSLPGGPSGRSCLAGLPGKEPKTPY